MADAGKGSGASPAERVDRASRRPCQAGPGVRAVAGWPSHGVRCNRTPGQTRVWVRSLSDLQARPLAGTTGPPTPSGLPTEGTSPSLRLTRRSSGFRRREGRYRSWPPPPNPGAAPGARTVESSSSPNAGRGCSSGGVRRRAAGPDRARRRRAEPPLAAVPARRANAAIPRPDRGGGSQGRPEPHRRSGGRRLTPRDPPCDGVVAYAPPGRLLFWREGSLHAQEFDPKRFRLRGEPRLVAHGVGFNGARMGHVHGVGRGDSCLRSVPPVAAGVARTLGPAALRRGAGGRAP